MRYRLKKKLVPLEPGEAAIPGEVLVEIMSREEYRKLHHTRYQDHLLIKNLESARYSRADLLKDCIIGTFVVPDKRDLLGSPVIFGYYMDREKLVFVDDSGEVKKILHELQREQILEKTSISHLFFELLEFLVKDEAEFLQSYEESLTEMEDRIMSGEHSRMDVPASILKVRKELARISSYYGQLLNVSQTLTENYNGLLKEEECAFFHLYSGRVERLAEQVRELREYALQLREMHQSRMEARRNHSLSFLTMATAIFSPLTLIAGWYGMNFKNMPELNWAYGYLVCVFVSLFLIAAEIWYFKRSGWFRK